MTIRRLLGAALTVPVVIGGFLLVTAGPATACTCAVGRSDAERAARADAVFVGTPVSKPIRFDAGGAVWTFEVSRVYKGAVAKRQEIVIPGGGQAGCGISFPGRGPFLVFAHKSMDALVRVDFAQYASSLCSGSRALADGGEPALVGGSPPGALGLWASVVGVGVLAAGVAAGPGVAALRARRRASAD